MLRITLLLVAVFGVMLLISCSGNNDSVTTPGQTSLIESRSATSPGNTYCLGAWQGIIDADTGEVEYTEMRGSELVMNILGFLEPPALTGLILDFETLIIDPDNKIVEVDIILKHPIPNPAFKMFDVRGIVFGPEVVNADGLTVILSPEYFSSTPFGYQDGLLGTPDSVADYSGLAGYKYFSDGLGRKNNLAIFMMDPANLENRGVFSEAPNMSVRQFILDWSNVSHTFFTFNYAIYANYDWPEGDSPVDIDDFDINTANSAEAFACKVTETANSLYFGEGSGGGEISLGVEVWDWQGDIREVSLEGNPVIPGANLTSPTGYGVTDYSYLYEFNNLAGTPDASGDFDITITVTDSKTFGEQWFMDLLDPGHPLYDEYIYSCFKYTSNVGACPQPIITNINPAWGSKENASAEITITGTNFVDGSNLEVRITKSGEIPIIGNITTYADNSIDVIFDLTSAVTGGWDVVVTNGCGEEAIEVTGLEIVPGGYALDWSGLYDDGGTDVACDESGDVYVSGFFETAIDLEPGTGEDTHLAIGGSDLYLSKFDSEGNFQWGRTWGSSGNEQNVNVDTDNSGNVFVLGEYSGTTDFDPGAGVASLPGFGGIDIFLSKFDSDGVFQWVCVWGTANNEGSGGLAIDDTGSVCSTGSFFGTIDLDPGPGTSSFSSVNSDGTFLSKIDSDGIYQWGSSWESSMGKVKGRSISIDGSDNVLVGGVFTYTVDFDPGPDIDSHAAFSDWEDSYLSKFDSSGNYQWVRTWGGDFQDEVTGVATDDLCNAYVCGQYNSSSADFDPGTGTDIHTPNGGYDCFLSKFDSSGNLQWAGSWGGQFDDSVYDVAVDSNGNVATCGRFLDWADLDPGISEKYLQCLGAGDTFVNNVNSNMDLQWAISLRGTQFFGNYGKGLDVTSLGIVYAVGGYEELCDFDPGPGIDNRYSQSDEDSFLLKLLPNGYW